MTTPLEELREQHRQELAERVEDGECGCGCRTPVSDRRGRRRYVNERHKERAYRHRLEAEAKLLNVPARLNHETLEAAARTNNRHADAHNGQKRPRRAPRPGVTVYLPSPELADLVLGGLELLRRAGAIVELEDAIDAVTAARDRHAKRLERDRARAA